MTAIMGFGYGGVPVLIGDVVESVSSRYAPTNMYFPSVGRISITPDKKRGRTPSGLVQKLAVIGDNLMIAWTGDVRSANDLLTTIQDANNIEPFSRASLGRFLQQQSPSVNRKDVGLIGVIKDGDYWTMFQKNVQTYKDKTLGSIFAGGSGARQVAAQLRSFEPPGNKEISGAEVIGVAAGISASLITHEAHHLASLENLYGGVYEIATTGTGKPEKIKDIMYVHWMTNLDRGRFSRASLTYIYRIAYWNELLLVRTVKFDCDENAGFDSYIAIRSVFRELTSEGLKNAPIPPLQSDLVCHLFTFRDQDGNVRSFVRLDNLKGSEFKVIEKQIADSKHKVEARVASNFFGDVNDALRDAMGTLKR